MKLLLLIFIFVSLSSFNYSQDIKEKTEEFIKTALGKEVKLELQKFHIPEKIRKNIEHSVKQSFFSDEIYIYKVLKNNSVKAYAFLDNVYGKSLPITFLTILDTNGNIISSEIIKYREPYGGGVASNAWNSQFKGKNSTSSYDVNKDINGISGATISVHSVTKGIHKITLLFREIKDQL